MDIETIVATIVNSTRKKIRGTAWPAWYIYCFYFVQLADVGCHLFNDVNRPFSTSDGSKYENQSAKMLMSVNKTLMTLIVYFLNYLLDQSNPSLDEQHILHKLRSGYRRYHVTPVPSCAQNAIRFLTHFPVGCKELSTRLLTRKKSRSLTLLLESAIKRLWNM